MTARTVKVTGLNEIQQKLDIDLLVGPELDSAFESFDKRLHRQGKGLAAQRNEITATRQGPLGLAAETSLRNPRNTGKAWGRKNERILGSMAPRVFGKMAKRIEERWAADGNVAPASYEGLG